MTTIFSTNNVVKKDLRIYLLFLCCLYFFSKGNTQAYSTASGKVRSGISTSKIDTLANRSKVHGFYIKKAGPNKVLINWNGQSETDLNYYTIERSRDGINYEGKAIIFTNPALDSNQQYSFADKELTIGDYFYRLRSVYNDGSYRLCATNTISVTDEKEKLKLVVFPNPSQGEIKIILPDSWLQQRVNFEFYNTSGQLAGKYTASSASKTETLNITMMRPGLYAVKAFTSTEYAAIERIIKR